MKVIKRFNGVKTKLPDHYDEWLGDEAQERIAFKARQAIDDLKRKGYIKS